MANTSINLVGLDFNDIKENLKTYLKRSDSPFKDVDFEGSNISNFIDVLAYNTYLNNYYLNMVASEMFLDTAQLKDSVISHAKELNYTPRSFRSAEADISFVITPDTEMVSIVIPKATSFTSRIGTSNYTFTTDDVQVITANTDGKFYVDLTIYEGTYVSDVYTYSSSNTQQRFVLTNPNIDTRSLTIQVIENDGADIISYTRATSFLGLSSNTASYFLQAAENEQYEIIFGDDVIGRKPLSGAVIVAEYRVCNGELPNGARVFDIDGPVSDQTNISDIMVNSPATGGAVNETIQSIKYNATRHYQNQERAVTTSDYETLLSMNFTDINDVSAYGGEDRDPPVYGKVFIAVDVKNGEAASLNQKNKYYEFIRSRSPISIDPVFENAEYLYLEVRSIVRYNTSVTTLKTNDISTLVKSTISQYNTDNLDGFKKSLRCSRLAELINDAHPSIISCDLNIVPFKKIIPTSAAVYSDVLEFGFKLSRYFNISYDDLVRTSVPAVRSTNAYKDNKIVYIKDDGLGTLGLYTVDGVVVETKLQDIGTVDYDTGKVIINNLSIDSYYLASGAYMHVYAIPDEKDISSSRNQIINILDSDIIVDVQAIKL